MNKTIISIVIVAIALTALIVASRRDNQQTTNDNIMAGENSQTQNPQTLTDSFKVTPISHATMVINWNGKAIYTDPVGSAASFGGQADADIILVTDVHGDHLSTSTLAAVAKENTKIVAPQAVVDLLPQDLKAKTITLSNGQITEIAGVAIEAVPMYNWPIASDAYHTKGRGNGYIIEMSGKRVYIAGDTGAIPEMKALKNIDLAFVCMNLPYTMSVEDAAEAVLAFKPKQVTPYHYRGPDGLSDINKFKQLVNQGDANINVELMNFYPGQ